MPVRRGTHPKTLSSGGNAVTFRVTGITWKSRGARDSVGTGAGCYVPRGSPISGGRTATKKLVAYDLGICHGRRAYLKMDLWFPGLTRRQHSAVDRNATVAEPRSRPS